MPVTSTPVRDRVDTLSQNGKNLESTVTRRSLGFDIQELFQATLDVHIYDPVGAHNASAIALLDPFTVHEGDDNVQDALDTTRQALYHSRQNSVLVGCDYTYDSLVFTFDTSIVSFHGKSFDFTGQTIELDDDTDDQWIFIDENSELVTGITLPSLDNGEIPLYKISIASGSITESLDYRYYTTTSDRKGPFTLRTDATSNEGEANFTDIQTLLNYIAAFESSSGSRKTIWVRGVNVLSSNVSIDTDGLVFIGDGSGSGFITGASGGPLINIAENVSDVEFRGLTFTCDHITSIAVGGGSGVISDIKIIDCKFLTGSQTWQKAIYFSGSGTCSRFVVDSCRIQTSQYGVVIETPHECRVSKVDVSGTGSSALIGIKIGSETTSASSTLNSNSIDRCSVSGFKDTSDGYGIYMRSYDGYISNTSVYESSFGMRVDGGDSCSISNCVIRLDSTKGYSGIISYSDKLSVQSTKIFNPRSSWSGQIPIGIDCNNDHLSVEDCYIDGFSNGSNAGSGITVSGGNYGKFLNCSIVSCYAGVTIPTDTVSLQIGNCFFDTITNYSIKISGQTQRTSIKNCNFSSFGARGISISDGSSDVSIENNRFDGNSGASSYGIYASGDSSPSTDILTRLNIENNTFYGCVEGIYLEGYCARSNISNNILDGYTGSDPTGTGIFADAKDSGSTGSLMYSTINGNSVSRFARGIVVLGTESLPVTNVVMSGNTVSHCAVTSTSSISDSVGIALQFGVNSSIVGNVVTKIGKLITDAGVESNTSATNVSAYGIRVRNSTQCKAVSNEVGYVTYKGSGQSASVFVEVTNTAAPFTARDISICDNLVHDSSHSGIYFFLDDGASNQALTVYNISARNNVVTNYLSSGYGMGIQIGSGATVKDILISDNQITDIDLDGGTAIFYSSTRDMSLLNLTDNCIRGATVAIDISTTGLINDTSIRGNRISDCTSEGISIESNGSYIKRLTVSDCQVTNVPVCLNILQITSSSDTNEDILISDCVFMSDASSGDAVSINTHSSLHNCKMIDCSISGSHDNGVSLTSAGKLSDLSMKSIEISGCSIYNNRCHGFYLSVPKPGSGMSNIEDFTFKNNMIKENSTALVGNAGVFFSVEDSVTNFTVEGCSFVGNCYASSTKGALYMLIGQGLLARPAILTNVSIDNNKFYNNQGIAISFSDNSSSVATVNTITGMSVSHNKVTSSENEAIRLDFNNFSSLINMDAVHNDLTDATSSTGYGLYLSSPDCTPVNLDVSSNSISDMNKDGMYLYLSEGAENLSISDNRISSCTESAIYLYVSNTLTSSCLSGNVLKDNTTEGIKIALTSSANLSATSLSGNTIQSSGKEGIKITCGSSSDVNDMSFSGNILLSNGSSGTYSGLLFDASTATLKGITLTGNVIRESTGRDVYGQSWSSVSGTCVGNVSSKASGGSNGAWADLSITVNANNQDNVT